MTSEKTILITGTSSGFGHLAAQQFADLGHHVFASMRGVNGKNAEAAKALQAHKNITVLEMDVTNQASVDAALKEVITAKGRIDVLVNNAGVMNIGVTEAFTVEQLQAQMDVNYFGVARMFKAVLPYMRSQKDGLVITVTSIAGRLTFPAFYSYCSSKFAADALAEGYRYELSKFNVDSVIIEPGPFHTNLIGNMLEPKDNGVLTEYGELGEMPVNVIKNFAAFMDENKEGDCNPQLVVDDMLALVNTPYGERPLRTVSGVDHGTRALNDAYATFSDGILETMEMTDLDPNKRAVKSEAA